MQQKKIPLRLRLAAAIAGKAYIPSLDLHDTLVAGASNHIKSYTSKSEALSANVGWAYTANDAITKPASDVKLQLYRKQPDGEREEIFEHKLLHLLNRPNFAHTGKQMRKLHFTYMNFTGESYTLMMKGDKPFIPAKGQLPDSLHLLPAHLASFELGDSYLQSTVKYDNNTYPIASIIRGLDPNPRNPYYGQSKIAAAAATIDTDEQMKDWNRRFFANNARPGLIFSTNQEMSDESYKRWKEQFATEHVGSENAYKNLLVENGEAKPYMLTQQDLDFLKSREFTRDEIFAMFHVSPAAVGMIKDANRSIMDGAIYIHTVQNVVPRMEDYVELLNTTLVQVYDPTLELDFENPVAEDKDQKLKEAEKAVNKWMTIDEVRALYGMEALPDDLGTQIYGESKLTPLSTIAAATEPQDAPDEDDKEPEDPNPEDDPDDPVADEPATDPADKSLKTKSAEDDRQARGNNKADDYTIKASRYEETMLQALRAQFEVQRARVLGNLETAQMPTKSYTKKDWINDLVEWDGFDDDMAEALKPLIAIVVTETGQSAIKDVGLSPSQFNPYTEPIKQFMDQRSTKIAKDVNDETEKQLRATLSQGLQAGETSFELRARVEQVFGSALTVRADRIARTESARAQTFGDIEAWSQSGVVEAKEWYTAPSDVCEFCRPMDGKIIGLRENFFNKGDVFEGDSGHTINFDYDDIPGPPTHPRCRCVILPVLIPADA